MTRTNDHTLRGVACLLIPAFLLGTGLLIAWWHSHSTILLIAGLVLWAIAAVIGKYLTDQLTQKRREAWMSLAASLGCKYSAEDLFDIPHVGFGTLQIGDRQRAYNLLYGTYRNREFKCFDYEYRVESGKHRGTCQAGTFLVLTAPLPFTPLLIRGDPLAKLDRLVLENISFESDEFSRRFIVQCQDKKFAYDVVHERAMEFLLHHKPLVIEGVAMAVLFHYCEDVGLRLLFLPTAVLALLDDACQFLDLLPEYLIQEKMGRSPA